MFNYFQAQKPQMPSYNDRNKEGNLFVEGKINGKSYKWKHKMKKHVRFSSLSHHTPNQSIKWKTPHPKKKRKTKRLKDVFNVPRHTI